MRGFDRAHAEKLAQKLAASGLRGTFVCEDGCLRTDGKPKSWQSKGEADAHQQKTGHRILLNPSLRVEEIPPEVRRAMERRPGAHGELDMPGMKYE